MARRSGTTHRGRKNGVPKERQGFTGGRLASHRTVSSSLEEASVPVLETLFDVVLLCDELGA